jgi:hypothetical protein
MGNRSKNGLAGMIQAMSFESQEIESEHTNNYRPSIKTRLTNKNGLKK